MRVSPCLLILTLALAGSLLPASTRVEAERTLASAPGWFEPNAGQYASSVKYVSRRSSGTLLVGPAGATFRDGRGVLAFEFLGAKSGGPVEGVEATGARSSYLLGSDRSQWKHHLPHYSKVRARQVYPGIDVVYYLNDRSLEFDLVVAPGADPNRIRLGFQGAGKPRLDGEGHLEFSNGMRQQRPVAFQESEAGREGVDARYVVARNGEVRLAVGDYDPRRALVIDPILHVGYLGGDQGDVAKAVAVDRQGNVWVTGSSASTIQLPAQVEPVQESPKGGKDVFLAKFSPDAAGKLTLAYWTQLGGGAADEAEAIAVDDSGFVYLAGSTASNDFPGAGNPLQDGHKGNLDAFVVKLWPNAAGLEALWFSQVYGGTGLDAAYSVAVDAEGSIYFAGYTLSLDLKMAAAAPAQAANRDGYEGFLVKVRPSEATPLDYATYFGGRGTDVITAVSVAAPNDVYLAGYTASDNFPVTDGAWQTTMRSTIDGFLVRLVLNRSGLDALDYGTYLGGDALDVVQAMKMDGEGGLWLGGYTLSRDYPVTPTAYRTFLAGQADVFLTRFDLGRLNTREVISYSTYLGGVDADVLYGLAVAPGGRVALSGYTYSADFPRVGSAMTPPMLADAFVALLDPALPGPSALVYSAVVGGVFIDTATGVAVDPTGRLLFSGYTNSPDLPVTDGSKKPSPAGATQSFVVKVAP